MLVLLSKLALNKRATVTKNKILDIKEHPELFNECMLIYVDSFAEWEREDINNIAKNIQSNHYKMHANLLNSEVIGFYILDVNTQLEYALLSFLAMKESQRGKGLGNELCLHCITYFQKELACRWLLIEAQERQSKLYERLGFKKIMLEYKVPSLTSQESINMHLMQINNNDNIDNISLSNIIEDIFTRGYSLNKNDTRIKEQLLRIG